MSSLVGRLLLWAGLLLGACRSSAAPGVPPPDAGETGFDAPAVDEAVADGSLADRPVPEPDAGADAPGVADVPVDPAPEPDAGADAPGVADVPVDPAAPLGCRSARATEDAPDDEPGLYQVRTLYVLPADGEDEHLDTDGRICRAWQAASRWLAEQTGGPRLRLDSAGGTLDIGFVRLDKTDAALRGSGGDSLDQGYAYLRDRLERELARLGLLQPRKLYAVFYGGSSPFSCGGGAWPPALPGQVAALYLHGEPPGAPPCRNNPIGASDTRPGYVEYSLVHEILHTLGIVPDAAPHEHARGHVFDTSVPAATAARDLMYAQRTAADPGWPTDDPAGLLLDIAHDDYYAHSRPDLLDLAHSAFLTPLPESPQPPPGWRDGP